MFDLTQVMAFLTLGMFAGVLAGLLGVGGGMVIVPVLIWIFKTHAFDSSIVVHLAVGSSLATIVATSIASVRAHHKRGAVQWPLVWQLAPGLVLGTLGGAWLAEQLDTVWLARVFGLYAVAASLQMFFNARAEGSRDLPGTAGMIGAGGVIGTISGVVGIGGGSVTVPFLTWCRVDVRQAVGTSSACGLPIALAGAVGFVLTGWGNSALPAASSGYLYWPAIIIVALSSTLFAPLGAHLAHSLPVPRLKQVFALFLLVVGLQLLS